MQNDYTIDLTDLAEKMKESFVLSGHDFLLNLVLASGIGAVGAWFVKVLLSPFIKWVLEKLSEWALMQAFFINTAIRKSSQADDYINAINQRKNLTNASDKEYQRAEENEIEAFNRFVRLSN